LPRGAYESKAREPSRAQEVVSMSAAKKTSTVSVSRSSQVDFTNHLAALSARIECRPADTSEERQAIFELRYRAYLRDGTIPANPLGRCTDAADDVGNAYLFGLYIDGDLASALRLHIGSREHPDLPSLAVFPDVLRPLLDAGRILIELTCFVADESLSRVYRGLPYVTLRPWVLAAEHFHADELLVAAHARHQPFYQRAFSLQVLSGRPSNPQPGKLISLMNLHFSTAAKQLYLKYPFLRASMFERQRLFERQLHPTSILQSGSPAASAGAHLRSEL
jgi:hypothetical protein